MSELIAWFIAVAACAYALLFVWYSHVTARSLDRCLEGWERSIELNDEILELCRELNAAQSDSAETPRVSR